jgi:type II secretory ATPase GspE/PulE/Tfp pilus assembly ATPase PilB-like protein/ActR/RegA family two-component response regulator
MLSKLAQVLVKSGLISDAQAERYQDLANEEENIIDVLIRERAVPEEDIAEALAKYYNIPFLRLASVITDPGVAKYVSEEFAREHTCVGVKLTGDELTLAIYNPLDMGLKDALEFGKGIRVKLVLSSKTQIIDAMNRFYNLGAALEDFVKNVQEPTDLEILEKEAVQAGTGDTLDLAQSESRPVVKIVNLLVTEALRLKASDVHIEPQVNFVQVRHRIDGVLIETLTVPKWMHNALICRIKILSDMDIAERRVPQDGRIRAKMGNREVDIRVSCLPTHLGEKVVMRVLDTTQTLLGLDDLGFSPEQMKLIKSVIYKPQGTILTTGPTGSGKTSTLYACLTAVKRPEINIVTVENPIEYQIGGINQVQINEKAGLTFASTLRSILRQDPNVVLVGEIRDSETAEIAFQAAATGHLVFSTLHTNSAASSVVRLFDLGVEPFKIASSVIMLMAQRLVRRICADCREPYKPKDEDLEKLGMVGERVVFYRGRGCEMCKKTGFRGRIGVYEMLPIQGKVREAILARATEVQIEAAMTRMGMKTLLEEAVEKIRQGVTNPDEVLRVIKVEERLDQRCLKCKKIVQADFVACPYCGQSLKNICPGCNQELRLDWTVCPYCRTNTGAPRSVTPMPGPAPALTTPMPAPAPVPAKPPASPSASIPTTAGPLPSVHPSDLPAAPSLGKIKADPGTSSAGGSTQRLPGVDKVRVLVVDDEEDIRRLVAAFVKRLKYPTEVFTARDGDEGLKLVESVKPHLVILDILMPRMDGFTVCTKLRENLNTAFIPILMMTASRETETRSKAFAVGTDDYVPKPIKPMEFKEKLERLLDRTYGF